MRAVELEGEVHYAFQETEEQITDVPGISYAPYPVGRKAKRSARMLKLEVDSGVVGGEEDFRVGRGAQKAKWTGLSLFWSPNSSRTIPSSACRVAASHGSATVRVSVPPASSTL